MVGQAENTGFEPLPQPDRYIGKHLPYPLSPSLAFSLTRRLSVLFLPLSRPTLPLPQNTKLPATRSAWPSLAIATSFLFLSNCSSFSLRSFLYFGWAPDGHSSLQQEVRQVRLNLGTAGAAACGGYMEAANPFLQVGVLTQRFRMSERESDLDFH